jgi:hypothetical protein
MVDETEFWTVDTVALVGLIMSLLVGCKCQEILSWCPFVSVFGGITIE